MENKYPRNISNIKLLKSVILFLPAHIGLRNISKTWRKRSRKKHFPGDFHWKDKRAKTFIFGLIARPHEFINGLLVSLHFFFFSSLITRYSPKLANILVVLPRKWWKGQAVFLGTELFVRFEQFLNHAVKKTLKYNFLFVYRQWFHSVPENTECSTF